MYRGLTNRRMIVCSSRCKMAFPITIEDYYLVEVFIGYKIDNDFFFSHSSSDIGFVQCHIIHFSIQFVCQDSFWIPTRVLFFTYSLSSMMLIYICLDFETKPYPSSEIDENNFYSIY